MKKQCTFAAILALLVTGVLSAQAEKPKNTIAAGGYVNTLFFIIPEYGLSAEYERILLGNNLLGITTEVGGGYVAALVPSWNITARARFYPFSKTFFIQTGIGYRNIPLWDVYSFLVPVDIGWKADLGKPGGFVLVTNLGLAFSFGTKIGGEASKQWKDAAETFDRFPGLKFGLRLGYSF